MMGSGRTSKYTSSKSSRNLSLMMRALERRFARSEMKKIYL